MQSEDDVPEPRGATISRIRARDRNTGKPSLPKAPALLQDDAKPHRAPPVPSAPTVDHFVLRDEAARAEFGPKCDDLADGYAATQVCIGHRGRRFAPTPAHCAPDRPGKQGKNPSRQNAQLATFYFVLATLGITMARGSSHGL